MCPNREDGWYTMRRRAFLLGISTTCGLGLGYAAAKFEVLDRLMPRPAQATFNLHVPAGSYGPQKVVYHVNEKGSWRDRDGEAFRLVHVINNHMRAVEPEDLTVEVLFHGNGVDLLRRAKGNPQLAVMFDELRKRGVTFRVCANTLTAYGIPLEALHGVRQTDLVQAAVAEIVKLEREGYGYIRF